MLYKNNLFVELNKHLMPTILKLTKLSLTLKLLFKHAENKMIFLLFLAYRA